MKRLIDIAVETLAGKVRELPSGAKSLAHLLVVVPTAQSGRRLRLALARRFGSIVPPVVCQPERLFVDYDDATIASRSEEILAFIAALPADKAIIPAAVRLVELRHILAEKAMTFADVVDKSDIDCERWRDLAKIEERYLAELGRRGKRDRNVAMKTPPPLPEGVEEVLRFDDVTVFAAGHAEIGFDNVFACGTATSEAERIAEYFAAVRADEELPSLCVADPEMFPEIVSAFEARGLRVHNPASVRLVTSSLGQLVRQIASLSATGSYSVFSAFVRSGDVRRWICSELGFSDEEMTAALVDLDNRQAELLPETIDDIASKTERKLRAIFEFVKVQLRKKGVREILESIFRQHRLDEREEGDREFAAAAEVVSALISEVDAAFGDVADARQARLKQELFLRRLDEAEYSLEPDEGDVIMTDGWMELPFLESRELVIAGFQEGCVPESVVGHPYLPDSLRQRLGLTDNRRRGERDRAILAMTLASRAADSVKVFFHSVNARGDVLKPSRLIFDVNDDAELIRRVKACYGMRAGTREGLLSDLPDGWRLDLPIPPPYERLGKISPTRLDSYLRCPFTYFLTRKDVLGDKRLDDRAEELAAWEYGNLAHEALEAWGLSELRDSEDAAAIRAFLEERVDAQLVERFGTAIPAIVGMQGESVKRRLADFAAVQVEWRRAGWRIVSVERKLKVEYPDVIVFHGKCDRIDYNEQTGKWCVIDYKTWDSPEKAKCYDAKGKRWLSLQLPLYCAMLNADSEGEFAAADLEHIVSCYCVLGKTANDVTFTELMQGGMVPEAEAEAKRVVSRIERGIFWPPANTDEWQWDYSDWLFPNPMDSISKAWIADQECRLKNMIIETKENME